MKARFNKRGPDRIDGEFNLDIEEVDVVYMIIIICIYN